MVRGTFANVRLRNLLVPGSEGTWTVHLPDGEETTIFDASQRYLAEGTPLIVLAGKEYGSGSSRDWAAKGPKLLGVRAVIAESYERIHRSNLLMMGILPLQYLDGENARVARADRPRGVLDLGRRERRGARGDGARRRQGVRRARAPRHAARARVPATRRDPPVRAQAPARDPSDPWKLAGAASLAPPGDAGIARHVGAVARRRAAADHRGGRRADRRPVRGARRDRSLRAHARALPDHRDRRRDARADRRPAARPRDPRRADPRRARAAPARPDRRPARGRLSAAPPADAVVPRRADRAPRGRLREPVPDREGGRAGLHERGRGADHAARGTGGGRDRERAAVRVGDALAAPARVADGDRQRARGRDRARPAARADRDPAGRADRRRAGRDRAPRRRG